MTQDRIQFYENLLKKPMAEPHRGYIEELFAEVNRQAPERELRPDEARSQFEYNKRQAKPKGSQIPAAPLTESPE